MDSAKLFRFENLEVWQRAADLAIQLGEIADTLESLRRYRYAEQLRSSALSISNNIAEGSGSNSKLDFQKFLNYARRSAFECANMLVIFRRQQYVGADSCEQLLVELSRVCRMITGLARSL